MGFHENLRHYREKKGYTTKEIADLLGIAPNTYAGYEIRGREPKYNTLCKIADLLNVSTDELLGRENNILGMNEDERLKKELDEILAMPTKFLKLHDMNGDYTTFEICGKDENYIWHASFSKKEIVNMINTSKNNYVGMINAEIYKKLISTSITKAIKNKQDTIEQLKKDMKKLEKSQSPQKEAKLFEQTQMINADLEVLNKLQELNTFITNVYNISHPILDAINTMFKGFQR